MSENTKVAEARLHLLALGDLFNDIQLLHAMQLVTQGERSRLARLLDLAGK